MTESTHNNALTWYCGLADAGVSTPSICWCFWRSPVVCLLPARRRGTVLPFPQNLLASGAP
jgi:hypothetical protein